VLAAVALAGLIVALVLVDVGTSIVSDSGDVVVPIDAPSSAPSGDLPEKGPPQPGAPWFSEDTGMVLLFDDGIDGAIAVSPDTGVVRPLHLHGQRPGDQPFRLWPMGSSVVVGWSEIWKVVPAGGQSPHHLGQATYFVPHHDNTMLWLVDWTGGRIGEGEQTWMLIDGSGDVLAEVEAPADLSPIRGVPGGLAVMALDGSLMRYHLERNEIVDYLGDGSAWIGDVVHDTVAWCESDPCHELLVTTGTDGDVSTTISSGVSFLPSGVWLEPSGRFVAAAVAVDVGGGTDFRLRIYDLRTGVPVVDGAIADAQLHLGFPRGAWTPAGSQFFLWLSNPPGAGGPSTLFRWSLDRPIEQIDLRGVLEASSFVALPWGWVGDPAEWPEVSVQSSGPVGDQ
jgi:hypothetical protein